MDDDSDKKDGRITELDNIGARVGKGLWRGVEQ